MEPWRQIAAPPEPVLVADPDERERVQLYTELSVRPQLCQICEQVRFPEVAIKRGKETTETLRSTESTEKKFMNVSVVSVVLSAFSGKNRHEQAPQLRPRAVHGAAWFERIQLARHRGSFEVER